MCASRVTTPKANSEACHQAMPVHANLLIRHYQRLAGSRLGRVSARSQELECGNLREPVICIFSAASFVSITLSKAAVLAMAVRVLPFLLQAGQWSLRCLPAHSPTEEFCWFSFGLCLGEIARACMRRCDEAGLLLLPATEAVTVLHCCTVESPDRLVSCFCVSELCLLVLFSAKQHVVLKTPGASLHNCLNKRLSCLSMRLSPLGDAAVDFLL